MQSVYLYFTARSGFKSGGFNFGLPAGFTAPPFGPEHVHDEEIGIKTDFTVGDIRTRFNLDVFQTDYSGAQRQIYFIGPNNALLTRPQGFHSDQTKVFQTTVFACLREPAAR